MLLNHQPNKRKSRENSKISRDSPEQKGGNDYRAKDKEIVIRQSQKDPVASCILCSSGTGTKRKHRGT
jgi:hypothetical protein